jgi:hypothetical protein
VPDLTSNTLRYSAEIRVGQRTRDEALEEIQREEEIEAVPEELEILLDSLGITRAQFDSYVGPQPRHSPYQREGLVKRAFDALRTKKEVR